MAFFDTAWYVNFGDGSTTGYYAVPVWPGALAAVTAGTWCRQLTTPAVGSERCFVCVVAGTTGAAEPVWVVTRGADSAANVDGTVKWMECTGMAGPCGDFTNAPVWVASRVVTLGEVYYDSVSGSLQAATTGGTSKSGAAPSFSATAGVTTADNTVTWTSLGPTSNYTTAFKYPHARLTNAFASTWGAAGNSFYAASTSAESWTTITLSVAAGTSPGTLAAPCSVYSVPSSSAPPTSVLAGASITTTTSNSINIGAAGYCYFYGITFNCGTGNNNTVLNIGGSSNTSLNTFDTCNFNLISTHAGGNLTTEINIGGGNNTPEGTVLYNCNLTFGNTSQSIGTGNNSTCFSMYGGSIAATASAPTTLFTATGGHGQWIFLRDVDLSGITGTLINWNNLGAAAEQLILQNCKLGAGVTPASSSVLGYTSYTKMHNCDSAATNYRYYFNNAFGTAQQETTVVRSGSLATNGTTPLSWNLTSTVNSRYISPFISEEVAQWNDNSGSAKTATIYLTTNTTLNNNDFWAEVEYPSSSSVPLGTSVNSRMVPLVTPTALTTDSSTWGGGITNKYSIQLSFTPQMKGPVKLRFYLAKASVTVYVDPFIYLADASGNKPASGRNYLIPGLGLVGETAPSFKSAMVNING